MQKQWLILLQQVRAKLGSTLWRLVWFRVFAWLVDFVCFCGVFGGFFGGFCLFVLGFFLFVWFGSFFVGVFVVSVLPKWTKKLVTCLY